MLQTTKQTKKTTVTGMSNQTLNLTDTLYHYLLDHSLRESDLLRKLREVTAQLPEHNMQIAPEQGQLMQLLIRLVGARQGIETGTFTGYSALAMAAALPHDGKLVCCDISTEWMHIGKPFWVQAGISNKIEFRAGEALQTLDSLLDENRQKDFDFAFIDADKENYLAYYERCLTLVRPGGLIMVDNTLWDGTVCDPSNQEESTVAIRAFNDHVHQDERVDASLIPVADGLTLARIR